MPANEPGTDGPGAWAKAFALAGIGMMIATSLFGGMALGWLIDSWLQTTPAFLLLGLVFGIVVGVYGAYKTVRAYVND